VKSNTILTFQLEIMVFLTSIIKKKAWYYDQAKKMQLEKYIIA